LLILPGLALFLLKGHPLFFNGIGIYPDKYYPSGLIPYGRGIALKMYAGNDGVNKICPVVPAA